MPASTPIDRRTVRYEQFSDLIEDARRLAGGPHRTVGNWTFPQVLEHLASAMDMAFDGADFRAPWILRMFAPLFKNAVLTRPMKPGFRLPRAATNLLPGPDASLATALAHLEHAVGRFENEEPSQPHPFLGRLTRSEYVQLHLRHSALHMSFVVAVSQA